MRLAKVTILFFAVFFVLFVIPGSTGISQATLDPENKGLIIMLQETDRDEHLNILQSKLSLTDATASISSRVAEVVINTEMLNANLTPGQKITINLFDGLINKAVIDIVEIIDDAVLIAGSSEGSNYNNISITVYRGKVFALIDLSSQNKHYYIVYDHDLGSHFLYEIELDDQGKVYSTPPPIQFAPEEAGIEPNEKLTDEEIKSLSTRVFVAALEWQVFDHINHERTSRGRIALEMTDRLRGLARSHSKDMGNNNFFSHTSPTTGTFADRINAWNINPLSAGENIAWNSYPQNQTAAVAVNGWMNSTGHRNNILNGTYKYTGIGVYHAANGRYYFTQIFVNRATPPGSVIKNPDTILPPRVTLKSPANGASIIGTSVLFRWNAARGATKYQVQIRRANGTVFKNRTLGNVLQLRQAGFPNDGSSFKYRVRAGNAAGWGPWSVNRNFRNGR